MARGLLLAAAAIAAAFAAPAAEEEAEAQLRVFGERFNNEVLTSSSLWAIVVLERDDVCGDACAQIRRTLVEVENKSGGTFKLGWISAHDAVKGLDGSDVPIRQLFNITTIPHLLLLPAGQKKLDMTFSIPPASASPMLMQGARVLFEGMRQFLATASVGVKAKFMDDFLTKEQPLLPRVLLLSKGGAGAASGIWRSASVLYSPRAVFGHAALEAEGGDLAKAFGVDPEALKAANTSSAVLVSQAGPHALPPVSKGGAGQPVLPPGFFSAGVKGGKGAPSWIRYPGTGPLSYAALTEWLGTVLPQPVVPQISTQKVFDEHCVSAGGVCFLALVPSSQTGQEEEQSPLAVLHRVAGKNFARPDLSTMSTAEHRVQKLPGVFGWVDTDGQPELYSALGSPTLPALVALNPRKKLIATLRQSFTEQNVYAFVDGTLDQVSPTRMAAKASQGRSMQTVSQAAAEEEGEGQKAQWRRVQPNNEELVQLQPLQGQLPSLRTQVSKEALEAALGGIKGGKKPVGKGAAGSGSAPAAKAGKAAEGKEAPKKGEL